MSGGERDNNESSDSALWDRYVEHWDEFFSGEGDLQWPGDEWGSAKIWELVHTKMFVPAGVERWRRAVEIGPGSGKYTLQVLKSPEVEVRGYDVSRGFLEICEQRCQEAIERGRLSLHQLDSARADQMLSDLTAAGWRREIDAFFSIDAMVHVDLQDLLAYLITAALTLKPGGKVLMTLSNATSDLGFRRLVKEVWKCYGQPAGPYGRFRWLSPEIPKAILPRLGFTVDFVSTVPRDMYLTATLTEPALADHFEKFLFPPDERAAYRLGDAPVTTPGETRAGHTPEEERIA